MTFLEGFLFAGGFICFFVSVTLLALEFFRYLDWVLARIFR